MISPINYPCDTSQQVRNINKHWNPKFKKERKAKFIKVDLPNFDELDKQTLSKEEIRSRLKKEGMIPQRQWRERPIFISSTPVIFERYVVPEGDGKYSSITKEVHVSKYSAVSS